MSTITAPRRAVNAKSRPLTVSLTLEINGTAYAVEPIAHAPGVLKSFRLAKVGGDSAVYDVDAYADRVECSCPSYRKTHEGTSSLCKHGRALVICGLVDYADFAEPADDARAAYDSAREKLAAIAAAEASVRSEVEATDAKGTHPMSNPVVPAFDADFYRAQNAVAEGRALWLSHRDLHASEPPPAPVESRPVEQVPCCPAEESSPCQACLTHHEGPGDLSDTDGWDDDFVWNVGLDGEPDGGPDEDRWTITDALDDERMTIDSNDSHSEPDPRPLADQVDDEVRRYRTLATPFGDLLARVLETLSARVRFLGASDVDDYEDRLTAMLDQVRVEAEARQAAGVCG